METTVKITLNGTSNTQIYKFDTEAEAKEFYHAKVKQCGDFWTVRLIETPEIYPYNPDLEQRIHELLEEANYLEMTGRDWQAIYRNLMSNAGSDMEDPHSGFYTASEIAEEIEIFYNA